MLRLTHFCVRETCMNVLPITPIIATPNTEINPASFGRPMSSVDFFCGIRPPLLSTGPTPNNPANNITVIIYLTFPFILMNGQFLDTKKTTTHFQ